MHFLGDGLEHQSRCLVTSSDSWSVEAHPPSSGTELKSSIMVIRFHTLVTGFFSLYMVHLVIIAISLDARIRSQFFVLVLYMALSNNIYASIATWLCYIFGDIGSTILKTQLEQSWFPVMATLAPVNTCLFVTTFHER
jgi:hypothetical protein